MNPIPTKVLILGGYGTFGGRLAQLLAGDARVTLLIAGRSLSQAQTFCDRLAPGASRSALRFDREARERGVFILSGVSSFPVLTAAVLRRLAHGLAGLGTITGGIAPSPYAGVSVNVIRAIASYSGKRLALVRGGQPPFGVAMTGLSRPV